MKESTRRTIVVLLIASIIPVVTYPLVSGQPTLSAVEFLGVLLSWIIVFLDVLFIAGLAFEWIEEAKE
jgi:hypothetical protein